MTHGLLHPPVKLPGKKWDHCRLCDVVLLNSDKPKHEQEEPHKALLPLYLFNRRWFAIVPYQCGGPCFPVVARPWEARMLGLL